MSNQAKLQIIPLGGLGEIGKNMTAIKYEDTIVVIKKEFGNIGGYDTSEMGTIVAEL